MEHNIGEYLVSLLALYKKYVWVPSDTLVHFMRAIDIHVTRKDILEYLCNLGHLIEIRYFPDDRLIKPLFKCEYRVYGPLTCELIRIRPSAMGYVRSSFDITHLVKRPEEVDGLQRALNKRVSDTCTWPYRLFCLWGPEVGNVASKFKEPLNLSQLRSYLSKGVLTLKTSLSHLPIEHQALLALIILITKKGCKMTHWRINAEIDRLIDEHFPMARILLLHPTNVRRKALKVMHDLLDIGFFSIRNGYIHLPKTLHDIDINQLITRLSNAIWGQLYTLSVINLFRSIVKGEEYKVPHDVKLLEYRKLIKSISSLPGKEFRVRRDKWLKEFPKRFKEMLMSSSQCKLSQF